MPQDAMTASNMSADEVVRLLELSPHPEGGHYRETFRDDAVDASGRARATAIHYLLAEGERSAWHRVDAAEIWLWHAGAPLALEIAGEGTARKTVTLGGDLVGGETPQGIVPAGAWQAARSLGAWTLVSCVVAPGFEFAGFEMAPAGFVPPSQG
jgi:predicted cupin superfamily sugar epimerase